MDIQYLRNAYNDWRWLRLSTVRYSQNSIDSETGRYLYNLFTIARGWPVNRWSSAAACISRPSATDAPTLLVTALLAPTIPLFPLFHIEFLLCIDRCATWSPCRRRWSWRKQAPRDLVASERSLPLFRGHDSIWNKSIATKTNATKIYCNKNKWHI